MKRWGRNRGQIGAHRAPGLGIGLALVKSLVELHGGRVWVESEGLGRGSRFVVELPRREAPEQRGAVQSSPAARPLLRVLLVEDNDDARAMLAEALSHRSYEVRAEAVQKGAAPLRRGKSTRVRWDDGIFG